MGEGRGPEARGAGGRRGGWEGERTLQKSMLFTPLLPRAGPTGGEGEACPAPTRSLTRTSFARAFLDIVLCGRGEDGRRCWRVRRERDALRMRARCSAEAGAGQQGVSVGSARR